MELKIGTPLTLEPTYTDRVEFFHCKVVEQDGNILFIDYPINTVTKKTAFLVDGAQFRATFITGDKITYAFNTEVLGRKMGNIPTIMLSCPPEEEFVKIQRREFVRVSTPVDVSVEFKNNYYQFITEDISAGGIALILKSDPPFKDGDQILLTIVLPFSNGDIQYVKTEATVIRIFEKDNRKFASIQFVDTDDIDKQYIVRFCFERQLMIRRKIDAIR
ncbi:PilZ domain-containing protein [Lysinibacillus telephonicus]|uniref:Glycosyltransferase n=1 Tax=Lysinibacillus telephonicus TaxID=1714840 RepID=A0A3S0HJT7_9BACI|nr:flagellar brake domain-containing protein [Lysinibacillus telephonicus]RTQ91052.1 glycosyltransferase [Lysinibacillus telephonicus]